MKRILVVDDELPIRSWIAQLCNGYVMDSTEIVVDTAKNGKDALEKFEENKADIVFVDIQMPVMDGLEFTKKIREIDSDVYIIILTNFNEFEYARQAFNNKADIYVLKSEITEQYMTHVLDKAMFMIGERNAKKPAYQYIENISSFKEEFLQLNGKEEKADFMKKYNIAAGGKAAFVVGFFNKAGGDTEVQIIDMPKNHTLFSLQCENEYVLCVAIDVENSTLLRQQNVYEYMLKISMANPDFFFSYSEIIEPNEKFENVIFTIERTFIGLKYRYYSDDNVFFVTKREYDKNSENDLLITKEYLSVINSLNFEKLSVVKDKCGSFFDFIANNPTFNIGYVVSLAEKLCERIINKIYENNVELYTKEVKQTRKLLLNEDKISKIRDIVLRLCDNLKANYVSDAKYSSSVKDAMEYIFEYYGIIRGVQDIAGYINLNSDYLSRIFKKETGQNILNFLNNYRMRRAVSLLKNTDKKVYEISEEVGFSDANYFSKKFRDTYGISPYNYKNNSDS